MTLLRQTLTKTLDVAMDIQIIPKKDEFIGFQEKLGKFFILNFHRQKLSLHVPEQVSIIIVIKMIC